MNCVNHAEVANSVFCIRCGHPLCDACMRQVRGSVYCEDCLGDLADKGPSTSGGGPQTSGPRVRREVAGTNPGAAFFLGLIPGVGAIYNAEFFKAAVHILIFGTLVSLADEARSAEALFGMLAFGFYAYMPFEAFYTAKKRRLAGEGVELETPFDRLNEQIAGIRDKELWGGAALVALGGLFLLDNFEILQIDRIMRLWPVGLIVLGIWMLKRSGKGTNQ